MFKKNMSCEMRVAYAVLSLIFLLSLFSKFFAVVGLVITAIVAATGACIAANILGPIVCKKSVVDAMSNLTNEVKEAADEAVDKAKDAAGEVAEKAKDVASDVADKAKDVADDVVDTVKDKTSK